MKEQNEAKKKKVFQIVLTILVILVVCTLLSKTIYTMLLPSVQSVRPHTGSIDFMKIFEGTDEATDHHRITWMVEQEDYEPFSKTENVVIVYDQNQNGQKEMRTETVPITSKEQNGETLAWTLQANLKEASPDAAIETIEVTMSKSSAPYDNIVPLSTITKIGDQYCVYNIATRSGAFSEETYLLQYPVTILEKNAQYAAIDDLYQNAKIVEYTNKPLREGMVVSVVNN